MRSAETRHKIVAARRRIFLIRIIEHSKWNNIKICIHYNLRFEFGSVRCFACFANDGDLRFWRGFRSY